MGNAEALEKKLARHRALWNVEEVEETERPLITFRLHMEGMELYRGAATLPDGLLSPQQVCPEAFLPDYDRQWSMHEEMGHDGVFCATPFWKIPWIEAVIGCPIRVSGDSIWAERYLDDYDTFEGVDLRPGRNAWMDKLVEFTEMLVEHAAGRYPVGQTLLRGPSDMLSALRGPNVIPLDCYDYPEKLVELLSRCTEIWEEVHRRHTAPIPPWRDGYVMGEFFIHAPGRCARLQVDAAGVLSPRWYHELFFACDDRLASRYEYNVMHVHGSDLYTIENYKESPHYTMIQSAVEPSGAPLGVVLEVLRDAQEHGKRVLLTHLTTMEEIEQASDALAHRGTVLMVTVDNAAAGRALAARLFH